MSFFDNKQEVLDIELTQYGKEILSKGVFDPKYYSFFDEDIIYDSQCFKNEELQNYTQTRILEETPYLKNKISYVAPTTINYEKIQTNGLGLSLSNGDHSEIFAPAFVIEFKKGKIENVDFKSNKWYNKFGSYVVPQINLQQETIQIIADLEYSTKNLSENEVLGLLPKEDDTYVKIALKEIVFDIFEENVEDLKNNFEIEVYKISGDEIEILEFPPRKIITQGGIIIDDMLYDTVQDSITTDSSIPDDPLEQPLFLEQDKSLVTSYFNLTTDMFGAEGKISDKRLFIYDPELYIAPPCD